MKNVYQHSYGSALEQFFTTSLQEMYWAENHLINVLTTMHESATDQDLKNAFHAHKLQTQEHVSKLDGIFSLLDRSPEPLLSVGCQGLFDEGWQVIDETEEGSAQRDVALIIAAQKVEHYEIATYGSLVTLANTLGKENIAQTLHQILQEEKEADTMLTAIAESGSNERASQESASENPSMLQGH